MEIEIQLLSMNGPFVDGKVRSKREDVPVTIAGV